MISMEENYNEEKDNLGSEDLGLDNNDEDNAASEKDGKIATKRVLLDAVYLFNPISHPEFKDRKREFTVILLFGCCLTFCAGFINGCALSGFGGASLTPMSVSSVTGSITKSSLKAMAGDTHYAWKLAPLVIAYIVGSSISGFMLSNRKSWELAPEYGPCFLIGTLAFVAASIVAENNPHSIVYYYLIAGCNGLQNSMSSEYSSHLVRSCHLTGTTTDIGTILGQTLRGNYSNHWKLYILSLLFSSFVLGSLLSYPAAKALGIHCIIVNAVIFGCTGIIACVFITMKFRISLSDFCFGAEYHWTKVLETTDLNADGSIEKLIGLMKKDDLGNISEENLGKGLTAAGISFNAHFLRLLFDEADINKDGLVSELEFKTTLQTTKATQLRRKFRWGSSLSSIQPETEVRIVSGEDVDV